MPATRCSLRGGTYAERVKVERGAGPPGAGVLIERGERPVVSGQLSIGNPSYWTIRGIGVTWAKGNPDEPMARIYGGTGWTLTGAEIWGAHSSSGLHIDDGPRNNLGSWAVIGNCIHDTYPTNGQHQDHNIYVDDMSASPNPRGVIARNLIFNAVNGRGIKLGPGRPTGGAVNVSVQYNTIYNSAQNVGVSRDSAGVVIYRNILAKASEANAYGFELNGPGNIVRDNVGGEAPEFLKNVGGLRPLADGGANVFPVEPYFDSIGCGGFTPRSWAPTEPTADGTRLLIGGKVFMGSLLAHRSHRVPRRVRTTVDRGTARARRSPAVRHGGDRRAGRPPAAGIRAARAGRSSARQSRGLRRCGRGSALGDDPRRRAQRLQDLAARHPAGTGVRRAHRPVPRRGGAVSSTIAKGACGGARATSSSPPPPATRRCTSTPSTASCCRSGA